MQKLGIIFLLLICKLTYAQNGCFNWARAFTGSSGKTLECTAQSTAVDADGNVYTTGKFEGVTDFDPGSSEFNLTSASGGDIYISKLDASGNFLWAKSISGNDLTYPMSLILDADQHIYITGSFRSKIDFDPGLGVFQLSAAIANGTDPTVVNTFVLKLNTEGEFEWAKAMDIENDYRYGSYGTGITTDKSGDVCITGCYTGTVDFDPGVGEFKQMYNSTADNRKTDIFIWKLDKLGNFVWAKTLGSEDGDFSHSITTDEAGNVYATGEFFKKVDFDPGPSTYELTVGTIGLFILKLNSNGDFVWAKGLACLEALSNGIVADKVGNVYTTGSFHSTPIDFDPGPATYYVTDKLTRGMYALKLSGNGDFIWAKGFLGVESGDAQSNAIAVDGSSNVYLAGGFTGITDFDPGYLAYELAGEGWNAFITKLDANGGLIFTKQLWSQGNGMDKNDVRASAIVLDNAGNMYTTGKFFDKTDFDPDKEVFDLFANSWSYSSFVQKMQACKLGIFSEAKANNQLVLYPNPSSGLFKVELPENNGNSILKVTDMQGREIYSKVINSKIKTIETLDLEKYMKGIYLVVFETDNFISLKKIVIN